MRKDCLASKRSNISSEIINWRYVTISTTKTYKRTSETAPSTPSTGTVYKITHWHVLTMEWQQRALSQGDTLSNEAKRRRIKETNYTGNQPSNRYIKVNNLPMC